MCNILKQLFCGFNRYHKKRLLLRSNRIKYRSRYRKKNKTKRNKYEQF